MKTKNNHGGAKAQRTASVLRVNWTYFFFHDHDKAARAFALLSESTQVDRSLQVAKDGGPEANYEPAPIEREIHLEMVPAASLRPSGEKNPRKSAKSADLTRHLLH